MWTGILFVGLGSALGGMARFTMNAVVQHFWKGVFPLSTFLINCLGSLVIGVLAALLDAYHHQPYAQNLRLFLIIGVCGGFTTFSSFSMEVLNLMREGDIATAASYVALSVILCVCCTAIGYALAKAV